MTTIYNCSRCPWAGDNPILPVDPGPPKCPICKGVAYVATVAGEIQDNPQKMVVEADAPAEPGENQKIARCNTCGWQKIIDMADDARLHACGNPTCDGHPLGIPAPPPMAPVPVDEIKPDMASVDVLVRKGNVIGLAIGRIPDRRLVWLHHVDQNLCLTPDAARRVAGMLLEHANLLDGGE